MTIATTSASTGRSLLRHTPLLAAALAAISVLLLAVAPLGWRAGWWHYRFALLSLLPWAAYFGIAALIVSGGSGVLTSPPAMSEFPLSLVPTFLGPVMLLLHLAALAVISSASPANSPPP